jgi:NAD(P)-dependent dehydrogenase (short-subunit alcohol dehydrogenase family)
MADDGKAVALVTGAGSGIGEVTARTLAARGYRVFGTYLDPPADLGADVTMLPLDVRSDAGVEACVAQVLERAGRIDVLVNNAARPHLSVIEETPLAVARDVVETNLFGVARVTTAVLPAMRRQRRGVIINIGSLAGLIGVPGRAYYTASKFALEGYSEVLRHEVARFNIRVVVIEASFFRTQFDRESGRKGEAIRDYDGVRERVEAVIHRSIREGADPRKVAELVARVAGSRAPRLRYRVGSHARWVPLLRSLLPGRVFDAGFRRRFGVD